MHELSIASAVVETALRHAVGRPVLRVRMRVGTLRQVVPDALAFSFEICARGTSCEGAALEQERVAARLACAACPLEWEPRELAFRCPGCGAGDARVAAGEELEVESIVVREEEEAACSPS